MLLYRWLTHLDKIFKIPTSSSAWNETDACKLCMLILRIRFAHFTYFFWMARITTMTKLVSEFLKNCQRRPSKTLIEDWGKSPWHFHTCGQQNLWIIQFCHRNIKQKSSENATTFQKSREKNLSLEPDSNQWPKDLCNWLYSPPLYQLSYRGILIFVDILWYFNIH